MKIWIDADACPRAVKDVVFRAADRLEIETVLVANSEMGFPESEFIELRIVGGESDAADQYIIDEHSPEDVVVTADIPFANEVVKSGSIAIDPRGRTYDHNSVGEKLAFRNLMHELRSHSLEQHGGPRPYSKNDRQKFAETFDRIITRKLREAGEKQTGDVEQAD